MSSRTITRGLWCPAKQRSASTTFIVEGRIFPKIKGVESCSVIDDMGNRCDMRCVKYPEIRDPFIFVQAPYLYTIQERRFRFDFWRSRSKQRATLNNLDDHLLKDIGLSYKQ